MLTKENKIKQIQSLAAQFEKAEGSFVIEFSKIEAQQMTAFRTQLHAKGSSLKVIRNTLANRALSGYPVLKDIYSDSIKSGSNAFVLAFEDVSGTAKILADFAKEFESLTLKKGAVGEQALSTAEIKQLASLPSLDELRAKLLALFQTPATQALRVFNEAPSSFVRVLNAKSEQQ